MGCILGWDPSSIPVSRKSTLQFLCNPAHKPTKKQTNTGENMLMKKDPRFLPHHVKLWPWKCWKCLFSFSLFLSYFFEDNFFILSPRRLCFSVCWLVCWFANRITQKPQNQFPRNFDERWVSAKNEPGKLRDESRKCFLPFFNMTIFNIFVNFSGIYVLLLSWWLYE